MNKKKEEFENCPNCKYKLPKVIDPVMHIIGYRCSLQGNSYICKSTDNMEDVKCNVGLFEKQ